MTTELVLLLGLFVFIVGGAFFNSETGPKAVFEKSGPKLGARIEQNLSTGRKFNIKGGSKLGWIPPKAEAPDGSL